VSLPADDLIQPFTIEASGLHGRLVRLGDALDQPLKAHDYPVPVAILLGEAMALVAGLSGGLKFDGVFSLQARGEGPVGMLVTDVTTDGEMRGYADIRGEVPDGEPSVSRLMGAGIMAFTVDQGPDTEKYQGIVEIQGATLTDCVHHYFRQSGQFTAGVKLACRRLPDGRWRGGALLLQRLPEEENPDERDRMEEAWHTAMVLMESCRDDELCDPDLDAHSLLYRLFHEDGVRVFPPKPLTFSCKCSSERMEAAVAMLTDEELDDMTVDGRITVTCQFCNAERVFDPEAFKRRPSS
jgi:molecular chaperone Hsp33